MRPWSYLCNYSSIVRILIATRAVAKALLVVLRNNHYPLLMIIVKNRHDLYDLGFVITRSRGSRFPILRRIVNAQISCFCTFLLSHLHMSLFFADFCLCKWHSTMKRGFTGSLFVLICHFYYVTFSEVSYYPVIIIQFRVIYMSEYI